MTPILSISRLHSGAPMLMPDTSHAWESRAVFNPACILVDNRRDLEAIYPHLPFGGIVENRLRVYPALVFLLYRARGDAEEGSGEGTSSLGLAVLSPELELLARHTEPVLQPDKPYENAGIGDGRLAKIGREFFLLYAASSRAQPEDRTSIALASTTDFLRWHKHGLIESDFSGFQNDHAMLFTGLPAPASVGDRPPNGNLLMLHRPMEGIDAMALHWATSTDPFDIWKTRGTLLAPIPDPAALGQWIDGGAPPLILPDGRFILLYNNDTRKGDGTLAAAIGIALIDFSSPDFIVKRSEPILRPETAAETGSGMESGPHGSVYTCGAYFWRGDLYCVYGGGGTNVLGGMIGKAELRQWLL